MVNFRKKQVITLRETGLQKCAVVIYSSYESEEWITKAHEMHGQKYNYTKVEYVNGKLKVIIICPEYCDHPQIKARPCFLWKVIMFFAYDDDF